MPAALVAAAGDGSAAPESRAQPNLEPITKGRVGRE